MSMMPLAYFIELMPMYIYEVRAKMKKRKWFEYSNVDIARSRRDTYDTVRACVGKSGWRDCTHLAEKWLDQKLE